MIPSRYSPRCTALMRYTTAIALFLMGCLAFAVSAQQTTPEKQTVLIINSYTENAPWSQAVTRPINSKFAAIDDIRLEMVNLNSTEVKDAASYREVTDRIFATFADDTPEYVIMIGNFAFTMRDRIKKEWGDVPMLLLSRTAKYAPLEYYYAGYTGYRDWDTLPEISDIRNDYNLTAIVTPDFCQESIDLMHKVIPDLEKIVFISDNVYANRSFDLRMRKALETSYPDIEYEWLQASDATIPKFQDYVLNRHPRTAFLISTWSTEDTDNDLVDILGGNLQIIASAANPVFSLRDSYLSLGALGGVFSDIDESSAALSLIIDKMVAGEDMRSIPLYVFDKGKPIVNHQRMLGLGLKESDFPNDTQYIFRTPSIWEAHQSLLIGLAMLFVLSVGVVVVYLALQSRRINLLQTHAQFIKTMPWPYSKARITYDKKGKIADIEYMMDNMNDAFMSLLTSNLKPNAKFKMFPFDFISEKVERFVETGNPVYFTYHFDRTDTDYQFLLCHISGKPVKRGERVKYVDLFANDITKRMKAEDSLKTAMRTLGITLGVARLMPWLWDLNKDKIYYDGFRTTRNIGDDADSYGPFKKRYDISVADFMEQVSDEDRERIRQIIQDFSSGVREHVQTEFKVTMKRKDRVRTEWIELNAAVTEHNADGTPKIVIGSMLIITARKKQEEALIAAKERASESDRMKSAFLANMSHEIRTPLNAIVGFSGLIAHTDDTEEKAKYTKIIEHNNELLLHLVNDVLDLAKIESNTLHLHMTNTDLNEIMRRAYETVRLRISEGVLFNMILGADECTLKTDPNRLSQVLINLLTNAAKFTQKGSISYGYEINGDEIEFFVRDTGVGISEENQKKLFKRFSKLNTFVQGTGLGLSICKSFVEKMGGRIGVKSRGEGKGSTFWFTLPYERPETPKTLEIDEATAGQNPKTEDHDVTILVAEDHDSNFKLFDTILSPEYRVLRARTGQEAIDLYSTYRPELILMDITLPDINGFEATKEIRKLSQSVPIIAVTGRTASAEKDRIMRSGFNAYIHKPFNPKALLGLVKTQLSRRFFVS